MKKVFEFINNLMTAAGDEWQLAIRKKGTETLIDGNGDGFLLIPSSTRYWYADPFLFSYRGQTYVFVEMYDRTQRKGVIGFATLNGTHCSKFQVCLETPYHLSYPCVFTHNNEIYMVPESYQSGEISIYKSTNFPYSWEKVSVLCGEVGVDTTPIQTESDTIFLSTFFESKTRRANNNLYLILADGTKKILYSNNYRVRSAGHILYHHGNQIRPAQDCEKTYGEQIIFYQIDVLNSNRLEEHEIMSVAAPDSNTPAKTVIRIEKRNKKRKFIGTHTYNSDNNYEIIDLKYRDGKSSIYFAQNLWSYILSKFRK